MSGNSDDRFFLREDELIKTVESAGLVLHCPDHSPAVSEHDEQGSFRGRIQVELSPDHEVSQIQGSGQMSQV